MARSSQAIDKRQAGEQHRTGHRYRGAQQNRHEGQQPYRSPQVPEVEDVQHIDLPYLAGSLRPADRCDFPVRELPVPTTGAIAPDLKDTHIAGYSPIAAITCDGGSASPPSRTADSPQGTPPAW